MSSPIRNSRCGFSSSSDPPAKAERAAVMASSSLIPCLRADGETITHGPTHAQRCESPLTGPVLHAPHVPSARSALHQRIGSAPPETPCPHEGDAPTVAAARRRRSPIPPHPPKPVPAHPRSHGPESSAYPYQKLYYVIRKGASCSRRRSCQQRPMPNHPPPTTTSPPGEPTAGSQGPHARQRCGSAPPGCRARGVQEGVVVRGLPGRVQAAAAFRPNQDWHSQQVSDGSGQGDGL